jgi:molybdopterin molybdotransferase
MNSSLLDVATARSLVLAQCRRLPFEITPMMSAALGLVVAEDVPADVDSPPFAKALMDGYAVRSIDFSAGKADLRVVAEVQAGAVPKMPVGEGEAVRIFTGAPLPAGADAVVMVEKTQLIAADAVRIVDDGLKAGQHVLGRGAEMNIGEIAVPAGTVLTPAAFGLLAAVGRTTVRATPAPRVAILATGNELVEPNMKPLAGQIRNTNGAMLVAQCVRAGALPRYLGIARDDETVLRSFILEGLTTANVLLIAGGVSAGKFDLVPKVLADLGVSIHFHSVRVKPGKPLLFGTRGDTLVFGLPGNPVSSFVGFELFARPALRLLGGHAEPGPEIIPLTLTDDFSADNNRPTYHPAIVNGTRVRPLPWFGSADAFLELPAGPLNYRAGEAVNVLAAGG